MMIRDEIHGTLEFDGLEERIIDCATFQRLRRIRQMSVTNLVYPGANHTRFEHSLGTAHLSAVIARKLGMDEDDVRKVKLYGLLHDIGHTCFSHEGEDVLKGHVGDHEERGREKLMHGEIADMLRENFEPREIVAIGGSSHSGIISSDLGADRMDYLKRDALNTGVAYGIIDIDRIVHTLCMEDGRLCIDKGGLEAAEYLLVARFMMFSAVYMHRTVRIATAMLYRAIDGAISDGTVSAHELADMEDEMALDCMRGSPRGGRYAEALMHRKLYKETLSLPREGWSDEMAKKLEKQLTGSIGHDMIIDYPHQFFKPVELQVKTDDGLSPITELSGFIQSLESSEKKRMEVLVLCEADIRDAFGDRIRDMLRQPRYRLS